MIFKFTFLVAYFTQSSQSDFQTAIALTASTNIQSITFIHPTDNSEKTNFGYVNTETSCPKSDIKYSIGGGVDTPLNLELIRPDFIFKWGS